ncbi:MAG: N-acetylmuramoyl-L-alanine amidase [Gammaproteobacteria bacterium]
MAAAKGIFRGVDVVSQEAVTRVAAAIGFLVAAGLAAISPGRLEAAEPGRLQVQSVRVASQGAVTRVELGLSRATTYNIFTLTNPDRVVIDLASTALGPSALPLPVATGAVRQIRAGHRPGGSLRLVLDVSTTLKPAATLQVDGGVPRLTINLSPLTSGAPPVTVAGPEPPVPAADPPRALPVPESVPPVRVPEARPDVVVVVDAGHGGHDPGAHGPSGVREKDVTLAISRRLVEMLEAEPGMRGVLTRSDDRFLGLRERMERARSANAHLFVSIHADAAANRSAQGSTVYVLSGKAASDEASRRLAARENAALIGGVELGDKDPVLASVLMDLSQNASISSSIAVGDAILGRISRLGSLHRSSVQQAPFMVLKSPDVPSVLVETAYISNPEDERNLRSPAYQEALARAILDGVRNYFVVNPPGNASSRPVTTMAAERRPAGGAGASSRPRQHVIRRGDTLSGVASLYRVTVSKLRAINRLSSDTVRIGQRLRIPAEST